MIEALGAFGSGRAAILNLIVDGDVVHPITTSMLGDVTAEDAVVVPYYENIPLK